MSVRRSNSIIATSSLFFTSPFDFRDVASGRTGLAGTLCDDSARHVPGHQVPDDRAGGESEHNELWIRELKHSVPRLRHVLCIRASLAPESSPELENAGSTAFSEIGTSHDYPFAEEIEDRSGRSEPAVMDAGRWPTHGHPHGSAAVLETPYAESRPMAGCQTLPLRGGRFAAALAVCFLTSAGGARRRTRHHHYRRPGCRPRVSPRSSTA